MLFCRQDMHVCHFIPADELLNLSSSHDMSVPRVLDELGSDRSKSVESTQADEQGELGVTCIATTLR